MAKRPTNPKAPKAPKTAQKVRGGGTVQQKPSTTAGTRLTGDKRLEAILEAMTEELLTTLEQDYKPKER